jgi:Fe2+ transport system protein B
MTSKEPDPFAGLPERLQGFAGLQAEIDAAGMGDPRDRQIVELQAEVERLRTDLHFQCRGMVAERDEEIEDLQAEVEQLRQHDHEATNMTIDQAQEIGRLRAALRRIGVEVLTRSEMQAIACEALAQEASPTDACT